MTEPRSSPLSGVKQRIMRRGRPELYTEYAADQALLNTPGKRSTVGLLLGAHAVGAMGGILLWAVLQRAFGPHRFAAAAAGVLGLGLLLLAGAPLWPASPPCTSPPTSSAPSTSTC